jgi:hypothetical protein
MGALVDFYHACSGFPVKQTWLDAIKAGNFDTFDDLPTPTWQGTAHTWTKLSWVISRSNAKTFVLPSPPSMSPMPIA